MAILKGFPPSNTIQLDGPAKFACEMCGKEFWQSFPLSLCLDITDRINYGILPCRECWSEDQGKKYWGTEKNKWGDFFTIYSKVREGYTYEELEAAHNARKAESPFLRFEKVRFDAEELADFNKFYEHIVFKIFDDYWSAFRNITVSTEMGFRWKTVEKEDIPQKLDIIGNEKMLRMFWKQPGYTSHYNPRYYGLFRRDRWAWTLICNPMMPEKMNAVYVRDHNPPKEVEVCNGLAKSGI